MIVSAEKPTRYYVGFMNADKEKKIMAETGCLAEDIPPPDVWDQIDRKTLMTARATVKKLITQGHYGVSINERTNIRDDGFSDGGHYFQSWEWDEKLIED